MKIIEISEEVKQALGDGAPVVALESTIIAHGLPRPDNLAAAIAFESQVRSAGVVPATIAVIDGVARIGLHKDQLERVAFEDLAKASVRDLPIVMSKEISAATTVASTASLASLAGIRVFATGGLGGVHRDAKATFDESADISILASTPVTVISAGVKSILDISATLERLESLSVSVVGYQTNTFPSFWLTESKYQLDWRVDGPADVAHLMRFRDALGLKSGIIVANPVPPENQWDPDVHDQLLESALDEAAKNGVRGKEVTPFVLSYIVQKSEGKSLAVNLDLVANNIAVASQIARSWAELA
jgi:pseudouridine-5'-phosphate glycosidase